MTLKKAFKRGLAFIIVFCFIFEQTGFAQVIPQVSLPSGNILASPADKFHPIHLRYVDFDQTARSFNILLDKGDVKESKQPAIEQAARDLMTYFFTGVQLPSSSFWVNLRPDSPDRVIDDSLAKTDIGRIMLAADVQLKKDLAAYTSPKTKEGREYWDKLYKKAEELFGNEDVSIPTVTRPWIVPNEIILRDTGTNAYIYKATLKVLLESDYLKDNAAQQSADGRFKTLNDYSSQLIRESILPKLSKDVNISKRYAPLRQVYYSLILAQWFKAKHTEIHEISNLASAIPWSKETYFKQYQDSFQKGEYNVQEAVQTPYGQTIRQYFSGGINFEPAGLSGSRDGGKSDILAGSLSDIGSKLSGKMSSLIRASAEIVENGKFVVSTMAPSVRPSGGDTDGIPFAEYIQYKKITLAEQGRQALSGIVDVAKLRWKIEQAGYGRANIDALITRQAETIEQSILELVSNASDALTGRASPLGRFGMGALQQLAFVKESGTVTVETASAAGTGRGLTFNLGQDKRIYFNTQLISKDSTGTKVDIQVPLSLAGIEGSIETFLKERLNLFTKMPVYLNGECINRLDAYVYLNGDAVKYDFPDKRIDILVQKGRIIVEDKGSGMTDDVLFNKYLVPRLGENNPVPREQTEREIFDQVHLFYLAPEDGEFEGKSRIVFQISGVNIQSFTVTGYNLPKELIIQLPSSTRLPVSRNEIEIDASTYIAIKAIARKIAGKDPLHQFALMNGFMQAVKLLDEKNKRVGALQPLLDTAKEELIPFIIKLNRLVLPNDALFHQIQYPQSTLFLDQELIYRISPEQIPGSEDISAGFLPGTFKKAYSVPFQSGSKVSYVAFGPYLLINKSIYEKYKEYPLLLNLRFNFYVGYGRRNPDKGWIMPYEERLKEEAKRKTDITPLLEKRPALGNVVTENQKQWLTDYLKEEQIEGRALEALLDRLNVFVEQVPDALRLVIDWEAILPFSSGRKSDLQDILKFPAQILLPDTEFLAVHSAYFANRESPQRLNRYIGNLLLAGQLSAFAGNAVLHPLLSQVDAKALNAIDAEILDSTSQVFKDKNLEAYEDCFKAVNEGLAHVEGEAVKRLILRWMRIYKNNPKSANTFYELLNKEYEREVKQPEITDNPIPQAQAGSVNVIKTYTSTQLDTGEGFACFTITDGKYKGLLAVPHGYSIKIIHPYTENVIVEKPLFVSANGIAYIGNNKIAYTDNLTSKIYIQDILDDIGKANPRMIDLALLDSPRPGKLASLGNSIVAVIDNMHKSVIGINTQTEEIWDYKAYGISLDDPLIISAAGHGKLAVLDRLKTGDIQIKIIDLQAKQIVKTIWPGRSLSALEYFDNGKLAAVDYYTASFSIIDINSGEFLIDQAPIGSDFKYAKGSGLAFLRDNRFAIASTSSTDGTVLSIVEAVMPDPSQETPIGFTSVKDVTVLKESWHFSEPRSIAAISGGMFKDCIAVADFDFRGVIKIVDRNKLSWSIIPLDFIPHRIAYVEKNELAVTDGEKIFILDMETEKLREVKVKRIHGIKAVSGMAYIGSRLLAVSDALNNEVRIIHLDVETRIHGVSVPDPAGLAYVGDGKLAISSFLSGKCYMLTFPPFELTPLEMKKDSGRLFDFEGPDILASLGDNKLAVQHRVGGGYVTIVDYKKGEILWDSRKDERFKKMSVQGLSYLGNGRLAMSVPGDKSLVILDFANRKKEPVSGTYEAKKITVIDKGLNFEFPGKSIMIPEGEFKGCIAVRDYPNGAIKIFDPDTRKVRVEVPFDGDITDMAYIENNQLAVGFKSGVALAIVDLVSKESVEWSLSLPGSLGVDARHIAYTGNGQLVMGSLFGEIRRLDLKTHGIGGIWKFEKEAQEKRVEIKAMAYLGNGKLAVDRRGSPMIVDLEQLSQNPEVLLRNETKGEGEESPHLARVFAKMGDDKLAVLEYRMDLSQEGSSVLRIIDLKKRAVIWNSRDDDRFKAEDVHGITALGPDKLAIMSLHNMRDETISVIEFGLKQAPETENLGQVLVPENMPLVQDMKVVYNASGREMVNVTYIGKYTDGNPLYVSMEDKDHGIIKTFFIDRSDGKKHELANLETGSYFYSTKFCFTGFYLSNTDPVFYGRDEKGKKFFVFNTKDNAIREIASFDSQHHSWHDGVEFTGFYENNNPVFIAYGYEAEVFALDLEQKRVVSFQSINAKKHIVDLGRTDVDLDGKNVFLCIDDLDLMMLTYDKSTKQIEYLPVVDAAKANTPKPFSSIVYATDSIGSSVPITTGGKHHEFWAASFTGLSYKGKPVILLREKGEKLLFASLDVNARSYEVIKNYAMRDAPEFSDDGVLEDIRYDSQDAELILTRYVLGSTAELSPGIVSWDFSKAISRERAKENQLPLLRTGFAALDSRDDLSGLPSLERNLVRFLREKDIEFVEEGIETPRDPSWKEKIDLCKNGPIPLALLNYFFEKNSQYIKTNPHMSVQEFQDMLSRIPADIDLSAYQQIIKSAIEGQDRTERVWIREAGLQNPRDAIRTEREEGRMPREEGVISHANFIAGKQWVYSIKDPVGMGVWKLFRYYFPLDESSKDHLKDTGNLGQGNYTLYADYDEVFIRTSDNDGIISELVIRDDPRTGPTIIKWFVLDGSYKGTEVRRKKDTGSSDPQLESLFVQECLQRFGGSIQSPRIKRAHGKEPDIRDVEILYNGKPFADEITDVAEVPLSEGWGTVRLARTKERFKKRVTQDGIYIKALDQKELALVPERLIAAFERFGGAQVQIPREVLLNIPRNGYSQEHKFLHRLQAAVLYAMMQAVLMDYMDRNAPIPGFPSGYYADRYVDDDGQAKKIAAYLFDAEYDKVTLSMLQPYLDNPIKFFELLTYIPFTSKNHNGTVTLHYIREKLIDEAKLRKARNEAASISLGSLADIFRDKNVSGEFLADIKESAGGMGALFGSGLGGILGAAAEANGKRQIDMSRKLPDELEYFHPIEKRLLRIIGIDEPPVYYVYSVKQALAYVTNGKTLYWNLEYTEDDIKDFAAAVQDNRVLQEFKKDSSSSVWKLLETTAHESQHFGEFENAGDHTHHSDETIDQGFAARMGKAIDAMLFGLKLEDLNAKYREKPKNTSILGTVLSRLPAAHEDGAADGGIRTIKPGSSPMDERGGVDFSNLPTAPIAATGCLLPDNTVFLSSNEIEELNRQWGNICTQMHAGGFFAYQQTKDFIDLCKQRKAGEQLITVTAYIAEILRQEEDEDVPTNPQIRQILKDIG